MSFRYAFPRFSRMGFARGQGFGRRRGPGPYCSMYYADKDQQMWNNRYPFCRWDNFVEGQSGYLDRVPSGLRGWFNWRPWWSRSDYEADEMQHKDISVNHTNRVYEVTMNIEQFDPKTLQLKITGNKIAVTGKYESEDAHFGTVSQEFTREFTIPEDIDVDSIQSTLTTDGQLLIKGLVKQPDGAKSRFITIQGQ